VQRHWDGGIRVRRLERVLDKQDLCDIVKGTIRPLLSWVSAERHPDTLDQPGFMLTVGRGLAADLGVVRRSGTYHSLYQLIELSIDPAMLRTDLMEQTEGTGNYDCHKQIRQRIHLACSADAGKESGVSGWDEGERAGGELRRIGFSVSSRITEHVSASWVS
jgi:hypothetical protein